MTRRGAPIAHAYRRGGGQEKARAGVTPEKVTNAGRGGRFIPPVVQWTELPSRKGPVAGSNPARGTFLVGQRFMWIPECLNTREPATEARLGGDDCTGKGNLSLPLKRALAKEPAVNKLSQEKQIQVLNCLVEGSSIRSVERITGIHRDTIMRLMVRAGAACAQQMDTKLNSLKCEEVEVDEAWCYVGKKQKNVTPDDDSREVGDQYVFVAMDAKTKLIPSYLIGKRTAENAQQLMRDLAFRVTNRITLTTDGFQPYARAVELAFGIGVDYAQLVKTYSGDEATRERYSPSEFVRAYPTQITGKSKRISTSYIERQNLTMRMQMRRLTRLTNAFSKKLASLKASVALHFAHYNFMRIHSSLRVTPAMEAGVTDHVWTWGELLASAN